MVVRAKDNLPCIVKLTPGKASDVKFIHNLDLPAGSIVVMDKAYRNYNQYNQWNNEQVTWVTRLHGRSVFTLVENNPLEIKQHLAGVKEDWTVELGHSQDKNRFKARMIVFFDAVNKQELRFITNNFELDALTIAEIYRQRWQIELLFKRIKQNFQLHFFLGDNENAIQIQLWSTLIADLLIKIIKDKAARLQKAKRWSMANLAGLIRLHLATYIDLLHFLINPDKALLNYKNPHPQIQLSFFPSQ
ncbi:IS4 family transposase [Deminuibacter soli]|uniref:IS4 family transposase n=2 Tax=Deminuibacter soli TaxID=2291815 RepID=A0A3E1NFZ0_9BACT|nr:IS4 family transposase [Deminuibacter soli]